MLNDVLTTRREFRDVRLTLSSGPDHEVVLIAGCAGVRSHNGQSMGALLVFNDNTRVSKLEEQVRRTDRLASLGTLSAGMAHEIKNPLVTLKTFARLLPDRYDDEDFRETFSGLVGSEINRIDGIVNQLLDFARPAKPTLAPIELHAVVDQTVKLLKQQFKQTGIQIVVDDQASTDRILGDSNLLAQALLNFFLNAMDAMEMGGVLTVQTSIVEPSSQATLTWQNERVVAYLCLSIRDSGQGIAPEDLNHVFDPFFTTKSSGTGLGLSVSHGIVQEHGGMVDVESELGVGTVFRMYFPMLEETVVI